MYLIIDKDGAEPIGPYWFARRYQEITQEDNIRSPIFSMPEGMRIFYGTIRTSERELWDVEHMEHLVVSGPSRWVA